MASLNFSTYAPKEHLLPSRWAEKNVLVSEGNARPGKISFREFPFQQGILDTCVDPQINRVTVQSAAQVGKTLTALCLMGYHTVHEPSSQILMQPSQSDLKKFLEGKFDPMVAGNALLEKSYAKPRGREGANNSIMKVFAGGILYFAWSGSPNTMRGISAPIVICDEAEAYESTINEGHPVNLLRQRSETFGDRRLLLEISTPTVKGKSWIEAAYERGDKRRFYVVCPECSHKHIFEWENVMYDADDVSTALIHCPECGVGFNDTERISMVRYAKQDGGGWIPEKQTRGHASFQLSALYSPLRRLQDIVQNYLDVENDPGQNMSTFYNTVLGLTYEADGEGAEEHELAERVEEYPAEVPAGTKILTAGVDVQKDRLECEIAGWGTGEERWNIAYEIFEGDPSDPKDECYSALMKFLGKGFEFEGGGKMSVSGVGIDSGYNTLVIYNFVRKHSGQMPQIFALKGIGGWNREALTASRPTRTYKGYRPAIYSVGVDILKRIQMQRLNIAKPGAGYCHFPLDRVQTDYFQQLTEEVCLYDQRTNKWKWTRRGRGPNEAFDCAIYNYATLHILKPDLESKMRHGLSKKGGAKGFVRKQRTWRKKA